MSGDTRHSPHDRSEAPCPERVRADQKTRGLLSSHLAGVSISTTFTYAHERPLETVAQREKKSEWFLGRKTAWPKLGQALDHVPFLLVANLPKRTHAKEDPQPANTIAEGTGAAGSQCSGTPQSSHHERACRLPRRRSRHPSGRPWSSQGLLRSHHGISRLRITNSWRCFSPLAFPQVPGRVQSLGASQILISNKH